jgi:hypothetical protein
MLNTVKHMLNKCHLFIDAYKAYVSINSYKKFEFNFADIH